MQMEILSLALHSERIFIYNQRRWRGRRGNFIRVVQRGQPSKQLAVTDKRSCHPREIKIIIKAHTHIYEYILFVNDCVNVMKNYYHGIAPCRIVPTYCLAFSKYNKVIRSAEAKARSVRARWTFIQFLNRNFLYIISFIWECLVNFVFVRTVFDL